MKAVEDLCRRARRQWILEHSLRGLAGTLGWTGNACLLWFVLQRLVGLPPVSLLAVVLAAGSAGAVLLNALRRAPRGGRLAQWVDDRTGTGDLFASALEFRREPVRFGRLGELTCDTARSRAAWTVLPARWPRVTPRHSAVIGTVAAVLGAACAAVVALEGMRSPDGDQESPPGEVVAPPSLAEGHAPKEKHGPDETVAEEKPAPQPLAETEDSQPEKPPTEAVKITNEMLDRYLQQVPDQEPVSLEGITPIRWDEDETSGQANPQNQRREGEKIDPVKLDAAFLKDLEAAKKTKEEGGKEGSALDIAVMGKEPGAAAKGKSGGKEGKESLADAASKDPRGNPTRLATTPARKGLPITSAVRGPSGQKGQSRPMGLIEFLTALRQAQSVPETIPSGVAPAAGRAPDEVIGSELVSEPAATLIDGYFRRLREADR